MYIRRQWWVHSSPWLIIGQEYNIKKNVSYPHTHTPSIYPFIHPFIHSSIHPSIWSGALVWVLVHFDPLLWGSEIDSDTDIWRSCAEFFYLHRMTLMESGCKLENKLDGWIWHEKLNCSFLSFFSITVHTRGWMIFGFPFWS
jgi:hypothetical protein